MIVIQVNDIHSSDRAPRYRTDSYPQDIFDKLDKVWELAKNEGAEVIVITGDMFDNPQPSRVSHELVNKWLALLDRAPCKVLLAIGNHDLSAGRLAGLLRQPIYTLAKHPNVHLLSDNGLKSIGGIKFTSLPWNYGISAESVNKGVNKSADFLLIHAPIAPRPNPHYDTIQPEDIPGLAKVVAYGHIHEPHPVALVGGTTFSNPGSLARRSISQGDHDDSTRSPQVAIIDINIHGPVKVRYQAIEHRPSSEVYRLHLHEARATDSEAIDKFIQTLSGATRSGVDVSSLMEEVSRITDDTEVIELLAEVFNSVS